MTAKALSYFRRKLWIVNYPKEIGNISKTIDIIEYLEIQITNSNEPKKDGEKSVSILKNHVTKI